MADRYTPPMSPYDPTFPAASPSALRKAKQRQDSLGAIEESRYPTIESRQGTESQNGYYYEPPAAGYKTPDWELPGWQTLELEKFEKPETPTRNTYDPKQQAEKPKKREEYQGWHMQYTPLARPAGAGCRPQCPRLFDSRHWHEFERPEGQQVRCEDCRHLLGYYRYEVDVYGTPGRTAPWVLWSDYK